MSRFDDIQFSHRARENEEFKSPESDIDWWYITDWEDGNFGHKEGVCISIHTKNKDYDITLSTETLTEMLRTVAERISDTALAISWTEDK